MPAHFAVLVSDPDAARRREIVAALLQAGAEEPHEVALAFLPASLGRRRADLLVVGASAADVLDVLAIVARVRDTHPHLPVILIVSDSSEPIAVAALRAGVTDYLRHPSESAALVEAARRAVEPRTRPTTAAAARDLPTRETPEGLIGSAPALREVCNYIDRVSRSDATVLITGETGTGKELAAHRIHEGSRRRHRRFVAINCAAIPDALFESEVFGYEAGAFTGASRSREGLLQQANGGTIFLDEVGDLEPGSQAKLLRAIETRQVYRLGGRQAMPVDVRVVAATNQDLERAVDEQRFRKDLYFRLDVARVHLPPLRERRSDIPALIDHYLHALNQECELSIEDVEPETLRALVSYDWPGNVRELKNLIESLLAAGFAGRIRVEDFPPAFRSRLGRYCALPDAERKRITDALFAARWNKSRAAEMLQWSRMTLYRKMAKYSVLPAPCDRSPRKPRSA